MGGEIGEEGRKRERVLWTNWNEGHRRKVSNVTQME